MFSIKNNVIQPDEGFSVEVLGRSALSYNDFEGEFFIASEVLMGNPDMVISSKRISKVGSDEILTEEKNYRLFKKY